MSKPAPTAASNTQLEVLRKQIADLAQSNPEAYETLTADGFLRRRSDPRAEYRKAVEQAEQDGDPRFDFMVDPDSIPADKSALWVPREDVRRMSGRTRGYSPVYGKDVKMANGLDYKPDELVEVDDMVLMFCDRAKKEAREERERRTNREQRDAILKRANSERTVFVNGDGSSPEQMRIV